MNIHIPVTPELRVRLAHTNCLVVELPPEISTALEGREELLKSLTAADVPTDSEALRVERDLLSAKCDSLEATNSLLKKALEYADNKLYILTHNRNDVSPRLLTDADKAYKVVHDAWMMDPTSALSVRDAQVGAQSIERAAAYMMSYLGLDPNITSVSVIALREYAAQLIAKAGE